MVVGTKALGTSLDEATTGADLGGSSKYSIFSMVLAVIDDLCTLVLGTGCGSCRYFLNKGATALSNIHPLVIVIDDVGIVLSCNIQDDLFLYY